MQSAETIPQQEPVYPRALLSTTTSYEVPPTGGDERQQEATSSVFDIARHFWWTVRVLTGSSGNRRSLNNLPSDSWLGHEAALQDAGSASMPHLPAYSVEIVHSATNPCSRSILGAWWAIMENLASEPFAVILGEPGMGKRALLAAQLPASATLGLTAEMEAAARLSSWADWPNAPLSLAELEPAELAEAAGPWTEDKNSRRCSLVDKEIVGSITAAEKAELDRLQSEMLAHRRKVAPLPLEELREVHSQLLSDVAGKVD